jgi:hypothetical protein
MFRLAEANAKIKNRPSNDEFMSEASEGGVGASYP